ncbi:DUF1513 domain-containing protein [Rhodovulum adriaticum]|uniref:DUF1513 domain-containing protein n=1 Tax=Rhodovulum adriaticum TaxID=35804 RepID=A0A4R2NKW4_RHOAD|nr:DUF1513 domain-containing protein [Rhodovulum adriaticum]MBK1635461.1 twin-arginine translocation pathway signal [Rhodovulum adriaticum]TCP22032.1 hypothetical protein EV656_10878 [Rhodovulum adriaticum]
MTTRRGFLASLLAAGSLPALSWADAGSPAYLAAAGEPGGGFALFGLGADGRDLFRIPLPARGHAAAAHPTRPEAVAFARRPGTYALVIDCVTGDVQTRLNAPEGHHFYGHGCFVHGGAVLVTPENRFQTGEGRLGLWARDEGYARIGDIPSGGMGPHDAQRLPGGDVMAIANGGIRTHPAHGRDKLNIDTMRPNLAYVHPTQGVLEVVELDPDLHKNSIRHLSLRGDGTVAFAMQWQGDVADPVPLLGLHRQGQGAPVLAQAPLAEQMAMQGYAGSVSFSGDGSEVAITSPRGGRVHRFAPDGAFIGAVRRGDVCGLAPAPGGYLASDGMGALVRVTRDAARPLAVAERAWDNHLVRLGSA